MRYQGRIAEWNDERGFGFVIPNGGGSKVFLHVSAMKKVAGRPSIGLLVTYEMGESADGRPRAQAVRLVAPRATRTGLESSGLASTMLIAAVLIAVLYIAWVRFTHPGSTVSASVYKIVFAREALRTNPEFRCSPQKASCSAMSSCAEAFFHQERCAVQNMDGDHDGIPCEQQ